MVTTVSFLQLLTRRYDLILYRSDYLAVPSPYQMSVSFSLSAAPHSADITDNTILVPPGKRQKSGKEPPAVKIPIGSTGGRSPDCELLTLRSSSTNTAGSYSSVQFISHILPVYIPPDSSLFSFGFSSLNSIFYILLFLRFSSPPYSP